MVEFGVDQVGSGGLSHVKSAPFVYHSGQVCSGTGVGPESKVLAWLDIWIAALRRTSSVRSGSLSPSTERKLLLWTPPSTLMSWPLNLRSDEQSSSCAYIASWPSGGCFSATARRVMSMWPSPTILPKNVRTVRVTLAST